MHWIATVSILAQITVVAACLVAGSAVASAVDACLTFTATWIEYPLILILRYLVDFARDVVILSVWMAFRMCFIFLLLFVFLPALMWIPLYVTGK